MKIITDKKEAVDIILDQKIIAIFQGHSEWGARALGNRSFLFDPRNPKAKEIVNKFKGRQFWRPTAATILYEHRNHYLDMHGLDESPYMTFAIDAKPKALKEVPAVVHVDGTCRFQTLKRKQNPKYYDLIKEFYKRTKVPLLLNTSFNMKGFPIVETKKDAIFTLKERRIKYMYMPEREL